MKRYNIDQLYDLYEREYTKAEASVKRMTGHGMYVNKLTKTQFRARAVAAQNSGIKVDSKYVKEFVDASKYEITKKQATSRRQALEKATGKKFTDLAIRRHAKKDVIDAWNKIEEERQTLMKNGASSKLASQIIAINYFGS